MPTRDPENQRMVYSLLAGREVSIRSEQWKHECEVAYLADLTPEKRKAILYGVLGAEGDEARGIKRHRGDAATA
ncbi:DUF7696 family protein [Bosea lathyri]|uniref:Uncharacterized protein n=1 Tax=Bosea lathyri TaxID=1036778 RepID=A0A1H6D5J0_9HYPH|nr:hypothetical protein [Bosea lathyri]SEG80324.1 hypothetical protein SAMN04488115_11632 [Bosea lathyri]